MFEGWLPRDDNGFTRSEEKIMLLSFSDQGRKYFQFREALKKNPDMFKEFKLSKLQVIVTTSKYCPPYVILKCSSSFCPKQLALK